MLRSQDQKGMIDKDAIFHDVQRQVQAFIKDRGIPEEASCLYYAVYGVLALKKLGLRAVLQAGSAGWMRIQPREDDGVIATHFSYMWTPTEPLSRAALARGLMPEMHVWIALPDEQTIVDFTSGMFPAQAKKLAGFDWTGDLPPLYFWGVWKDLGEAFYTPDIKAIVFALGKVRAVMDDSGKFGWATETLEGIKETVERTEHTTEGQRDAIDNIAKSKPGWDD